MFRKLLLVSFSILLSLLFCEFLLRVFLTQNVGGYFMRQNENGLWILKNNYKYYEKEILIVDIYQLKQKLIKITKN